MLFRSHYLPAWGLAFLAIVIPASAEADRLISSDFTQDGGTFVVTPNPTARLVVTHISRDPLLLLTGGATTSGIQGVIVGRFNNEQGRLQVQDGSQITDGVALIGEYFGSTGTVIITDPGTIWSNSTMNVGYQGTGFLNIENGALVTSAEGILGTTVGAAGTATVTGPNASWEIRNSLSVGSSGTGELKIQNGGAVTSDFGYVGNYPESTGTAIVTGAGSKWTNTAALRIGAEGGTGGLQIKDGGSVASGSGAIGYAAGSEGTVVVTGIESQWNVDSSLTVGFQGTGTLHIEKGGYISNDNGTLGSNADSVGTATVADAHWHNENRLYVGTYGTGTLNIEAGGLVTNDVGYMGYNSSSVSTVNVAGEGASWLNGTSLLVGLFGTATLNIKDGGLVASPVATIGIWSSVTGHEGTLQADVTSYGLIAPGSQEDTAGKLTIDGNLTQSEIGRLAFELVNASVFDQLLITGLAELGGVVDIDLYDGFAPTPGTSFRLMEFASFVDAGFTFDFSDAQLANPEWSWDTSSFAIDGTIRVVPEPSAVILSVMAGMAFLGLAAKNRRGR